MPTYDYRCNACGHTFEHFQSISEALLKKCPKCRKAKLERLIGAGAGFLFKGSGFYITDYRSSSYEAAAKKESGDGKAATGSTPTTPAAATPSAGPTGTATPSKEAASSPAPAPAPPKSSDKPSRSTAKPRDSKKR